MECNNRKENNASPAESKFDFYFIDNLSMAFEDEDEIEDKDETEEKEDEFGSYNFDYTGEEFMEENDRLDFEDELVKREIAGIYYTAKQSDTDFDRSSLDNDFEQLRKKILASSELQEIMDFFDGDQSEWRDELTLILDEYLGHTSSTYGVTPGHENRYFEDNTYNVYKINYLDYIISTGIYRIGSYASEKSIDFLRQFLDYPDDIKLFDQLKFTSFCGHQTMTVILYKVFEALLNIKHMNIKRLIMYYFNKKMYMKEITDAVFNTLPKPKIDLMLSIIEENPIHTMNILSDKYNQRHSHKMIADYLKEFRPDSEDYHIRSFINEGIFGGRSHTHDFGYHILFEWMLVAPQNQTDIVFAYSENSTNYDINLSDYLKIIRSFRDKGEKKWLDECKKPNFNIDNVLICLRYLCDSTDTRVSQELYSILKKGSFDRWLESKGKLQLPLQTIFMDTVDETKKLANTMRDLRKH